MDKLQPTNEKSKGCGCGSSNAKSYNVVSTHKQEVLTKQQEILIEKIKKSNAGVTKNSLYKTNTRFFI